MTNSGRGPGPGRLPAGQAHVIFDEVHKYAQWRNLIKGVFDKHRSAVRFIVTGWVPAHKKPEQSADPEADPSNLADGEGSADTR